MDDQISNSDEDTSDNWRQARSYQDRMETAVAAKLPKARNRAGNTAPSSKERVPQRFALNSNSKSRSDMATSWKRGGKRGQNPTTSSFSGANSFGRRPGLPRIHTNGIEQRFAQLKLRKNNKEELAVKLRKYLSLSTSEAIHALNSKKEEWVQLLQDLPSAEELKGKQSGNDLLLLILQIVDEKVCSDETALETDQNEVLIATIGNANFRQKISETLQHWTNKGPGGPSRDTEYQRNSRVQGLTLFLERLANVSEFAMRKAVQSGGEFVKAIYPQMLCMFVYWNETNTQATEDMMNVKKRLEDLYIEADKIEKDVKRQNEELRLKKSFQGRNRSTWTEEELECIHSMEPPRNFRFIRDLPDVFELLSPEPVFLRPNKIRGGYNSDEHYLDVQFRLLREDYFRPLKEGIQDYLENRDTYLSGRKKLPIGNIRAYENTRVTNTKVERNGCIQYLQLEERIYRNIRWSSSKRLLNGSLVVLTPDDFNSIFYGTVQERLEEKLRSEGTFGIIWCEDYDLGKLKRWDRFLMIESEAFYEAYRHTLQVLKTISLKNMPLKKFIVDGSSEVGPPSYLIREQVAPSQLLSDKYAQLDCLAQRRLMKIGNEAIDPLTSTWPSASDLRLDQKQYEAFKACLTKEFVIVQGPPGTGKTYLGLQVASSLLRNHHLWGDRPILVICYTNHALDQFLEGILREFQDDMNLLDRRLVRVGGRSKSPELMEFSLAKLREQARKESFVKWDGSELHEAGRDVDRCSQEYNYLKFLTDGSNASGIIVFDRLTGFLQQLEARIPASLLQQLSQPETYCFDPALFHESTDIQAMLLQYFKIKALSQFNDGEKNGYNNFSGALEEDYDTEELLNARILFDDIEEEIESDRSAYRLSVKVPLMMAIDISNLESDISYRNRLLNHLRKKQMNGNALGKHEILEKEEHLSSIRQAKIELTPMKKFQDFTAKVLKLKGKGELVLPKVSETDLKTITNLMDYDVDYRWSVYFTALNILGDIAVGLVPDAYKLYAKAQKRYQELRNSEDAKIVRRSLVVGMTTTGAAKYNSLLRLVQPEIVIVEEAAEVLETHIVTSLTPSCKQLILIGDHKQLRPSNVVFELARNYNLDISLFERMVMNNLHCYTLDLQYRMRPEIADLVVGTIYDDLKNAPRVCTYPKVRGLDKNLFFITHTRPETSNFDSQSKSNTFEADYLVQLCWYLLMQGYGPEQITILTTYTGQMFLIKAKLRDCKLSHCNEVKVTTVDNFQGEENDIILLSLVRSNTEENIGFLKTSNRVCVALSRAKHGFFIVGNLTLLRKKSDLWDKIAKKLSARGEVGEALKIVCDQHKFSARVKEPQSFKEFAPRGGCVLPCEALLKCGHICKAPICHSVDREHNKYACMEPCEKSCPILHPCKKRCHEECGYCLVSVSTVLDCGHTVKIPCFRVGEPTNCTVLVEKELLCGHFKQLECWIDIASYDCEVEVLKFLTCGHNELAACHQNEESITCQNKVDKTLKCGHLASIPCGVDEENFECNVNVDVHFDACGHKMTRPCHLSHSPCTLPCGKVLKCGHECAQICHPSQDPGHKTVTCNQPCVRKCENGHPCKLKRPCNTCVHWKKTRCSERMEKTLRCGHSARVDCHESIDSYRCHETCMRKLPCGHPCPKKCSEKCGPCKTKVEKEAPCGHKQMFMCYEEAVQSKCTTIVDAPSLASCGHVVQLECRSASDMKPFYLVNLCKAPCTYQFPDEDKGGCGHTCKGTCRKCHRGKLHVKCSEPCNRLLPCGHRCEALCGVPCPPCLKSCGLECEHKKCHASCGYACVKCEKQCANKCVHRSCDLKCFEDCEVNPCDVPCDKTLNCGHPCIGLCGERCPKLCLVCNFEELTEYKFPGFEDVAHSRFIELEPCGHVFEVQGLDDYMFKQSEEILAKSCPRCGTVIRKCNRYRQILRSHMNDIVAIKTFQKKKESELKSYSTKLGSRLNGLLMTCGPDYKFFCTHLWKKLFTERKEKKKKVITPKKADMRTLKSVEVLLGHVTELVALLPKLRRDKWMDTLSPVHRTKFTGMVKELFENLMTRNLPLSRAEVISINAEFSRMYDWYRYLGVLSAPGYENVSDKMVEQKILGELQGFSIYSEYSSNTVAENLTILSRKLLIPLDLTDKAQSKFNFPEEMCTQKWFKCPIGHVRAVPEISGDDTVIKPCKQCD